LSGPMLAVYGRTVTWKHLILTAGLLLVLMGVAAAGVAWWAWHNLAAQVVLKDQQADILLPQELAVTAAVTQKVKISLDNQSLPVRVPIHQELSIPLTQAIAVKVSLNTVVPVKIDVPIKQVLKIDQVIDLDTQVKTRILGMSLMLPIQGKIPVKADVPVDLVIPVHKDLPLVLVAPVTVRFSEPLRTTLDTVIETRVPLHGAMSLPLMAPVSARLTFPQQKVTAGLALLDLTVPFEDVTLAPRQKRTPP
jgi:hypothetical protein